MLEEPNCQGCDGTGKQKYWTSDMKEKGIEFASQDEWPEDDCMNKHTSWEDLKEAMKIFIKCKNEDHCLGCEYEQDEVLSMIYHYVENEKEKAE